MMGSSNLDNQHLEELNASSLAAAPSFHGVESNHEWSQPLMLNYGDFIANGNELLSSHGEFSPLVVQDVGFQWGGNAGSFMNQAGHQLHLARIKDESLLDTFPKLTEAENYKIDSLFEQSNLANLEGGTGNFSMVDLPSANNISRLPCSLDMDLQVLDRMASTRFGRRFYQPSSNIGMALLRGQVPYDPALLQEAPQGPSSNHHKMPSLRCGVREGRANNSLEHKAAQTTPRKSWLDSRSPISSFKGRKEKLGDRIAALQQLVAPFGKTDTASVLMEAIGYIKFLQDQVETLSVPYMRSSKNKKLKTIEGVSEEEKGEAKPDLRSRGLCLVPLSCTSYVTCENGGAWLPSNYRGSA
ncbi:transcription factor bHLH110-like [Typha latifolia]|uniref:transcription factor bHLH110-like n=1 Tax=Typha latifolia TaxID=4733 RepID=UPI003C2D8215